jgi:hypothetical protein
LKKKKEIDGRIMTFCGEMLGEEVNRRAQESLFSPFQPPYKRRVQEGFMNFLFLLPLHPLQRG